MPGRVDAGTTPTGSGGGGAPDRQVPCGAWNVAVTGAGMRARSYHASPGKIKSVGSCLAGCE
jgi:hypothetical protein